MRSAGWGARLPRHMTDLFSQARAQELLADHIEPIGACLHAAVDRFNQARAVLGPVSARSKASLISDFAADHADVVFAGTTEVNVVRSQDLAVVNCGGLVCVRFRKLADGWNFSRNDTNQTKKWERQAPLLGLEEAVNLAAAYRMDETGRELEVTALVFSINRRYQWHIEIPTPGQVVSLPDSLLDEQLPVATVRSEMDEQRRDTGDA